MLNKIIIGLLVLITFGFVGFMIVDEPLPKGEEGPRAEWLADQMLEALNKPAWDSLTQISWSYPGGHDYVWNKTSGEVEVRWDDYVAKINTQTKEGEVSKSGELQTNDEELIEKAFSYFYNDSFWLIAPYKVKDPGTIRSLVKYEGKEALLVQYTSGGVTPGDSYLWILGEDYKPTAWKFWVNILPIGGLEFSWEEWIEIDGVQISTMHKGLLDIKITNLK